MKAVYIGAGTDVRPVQFLTYIKDFVFIDCQPFSEFGTMVHECNPEWCSKNCNGFSRPRFIPKLKEQMEKIGMKYEEISDNELKFTNETQTVTYFVNTAMPDHIDRVKERIKDFDNFIVMGHDPDSTAIKYTTKNITFWGNTKTVYSKCDDDENKNALCFRIHRENTIRERFLRFNIIDGDDVTNFDNWSNFVSRTVQG